MITDLEEMEFSLIPQWDENISGMQPDDAKAKITELCEDNANMIIIRWRILANLLIAKYADGYMNLPGQPEAVNIGYSSEWLNVTDYKNGPTTYDMK